MLPMERDVYKRQSKYSSTYLKKGQKAEEVSTVMDKNGKSTKKTAAYTYDMLGRITRETKTGKEDLSLIHIWMPKATTFPRRPAIFGEKIKRKPLPRMQMMTLAERSKKTRFRKNIRMAGGFRLMRQRFLILTMKMEM